MKRKILYFSLLAFLLVFVGSCAALNVSLDTKEKQFLVVQKEVNAALESYKTFLFQQTPADQVKLHTTYDEPIKAMSAALDAWQQVVKGITLDTGQVEEFMRIKNELIVLGWNFFKGGDE